MEVSNSVCVRRKSYLHHYTEFVSVSSSSLTFMNIDLTSTCLQAEEIGHADSIVDSVVNEYESIEGVANHEDATTVEAHYANAKSNINLPAF